MPKPPRRSPPWKSACVIDTWLKCVRHGEATSPRRALFAALLPPPPYTPPTRTKLRLDRRREGLRRRGDRAERRQDPRARRQVQELHEPSARPSLRRARPRRRARRQNEEAKEWSLRAHGHDPFLPIATTSFTDARKAWVAVARARDDVRRAGWILERLPRRFKQSHESALGEKWAECIEKGEAPDRRRRQRLHAACRSRSARRRRQARRLPQATTRRRSTARQIGDADLAKMIQSASPRLCRASVTSSSSAPSRSSTPRSRSTTAPSWRPASASLHRRSGRAPYPRRGRAPRRPRLESDERSSSRRARSATAREAEARRDDAGAARVHGLRQTREDILMCLPQLAEGARGSREPSMSGYTDTLDVRPVARRARQRRLADAGLERRRLVPHRRRHRSPDVVASASRRFADLRHDVALTGGYKPNNYGAQLCGALPRPRRDYISRTIGVTGLRDFREVHHAPSLGYSFTWNTLRPRRHRLRRLQSRLYSFDITAASTRPPTPPRSLVFRGAPARGMASSRPHRYIARLSRARRHGAEARRRQREVNAARLPTKPPSSPARSPAL